MLYVVNMRTDCFIIMIRNYILTLANNHKILCDISIFIIGFLLHLCYTDNEPFLLPRSKVAHHDLVSLKIYNAIKEIYIFKL